MVPPQGVGAQAHVLLDLDVVLLDVHGGELEQGDVPQAGEQVVVDNLLVAVDGGLRPGGPDDVVHPALQPVGQGEVVLGGAELLLPVGQKVPQAYPGGVKGPVGLIPLDPPALLVLAQVHADVVDFPNVVIGNVALYCLSCHSVDLHIFFSSGVFSGIGKKFTQERI